MKKPERHKQYLTKVLSFVLLVSMVVNMTACSSFAITKVKATDLMEGISSRKVSGKSVDDIFIGNTANFSIELFKKTISDKENALISPPSVMLALAMTANGADSETRSQMETVLGDDISLEDLNEYLLSYVASLPSEKNSKLNIANSIWFQEDEKRLTVEKNFLQTNSDYYQAAIYKSAFDDQTVQDINNWVKEKTDGMIENIVDKVDKETIMYLINAIVFDAKWSTVYTKNSVFEGTFTAIDDTLRTVEYMSSDEDIYLDDGLATGFIKPYAMGKYSFAALLPNEDVRIEDYIETLSGEGFLDTIKGAINTPISATIPKFSYDYKIQMKDALIALGMPDGFSASDADFSKLGKSERGSIFIGEVLHKTFIVVDELGTKAGAVTKVSIKDNAMMVTKTIELDRPFVYAIIDNSTNLPVFLGVVMIP